MTDVLERAAAELESRANALREELERVTAARAALAAAQEVLGGSHPRGRKLSPPAAPTAPAKAAGLRTSARAEKIRELTAARSKASSGACDKAGEGRCRGDVAEVRCPACTTAFRRCLGHGGSQQAGRAAGGHRAKAHRAGKAAEEPEPVHAPERDIAPEASDLPVAAREALAEGCDSTPASSGVQEGGRSASERSTRKRRGGPPGPVKAMVRCLVPMPVSERSEAPCSALVWSTHATEHLWAEHRLAVRPEDIGEHVVEVDLRARESEP